MIRERKKIRLIYMSCLIIPLIFKIPQENRKLRKIEKFEKSVIW